MAETALDRRLRIESQRVLEALLPTRCPSGASRSAPLMVSRSEPSAADELAAIPEGVLKRKSTSADVTLKGPTTTPEQGDGWPNIESANVAMRKVLDLFANVRPVRVPAEGIDWTFFRENTEDLYAVGSEGFSIGDLNIDFKILSNPGSERIIRAAFDYAQANGKNSVTIVTKANVIKTTDGAPRRHARKVGEDYPGIRNGKVVTSTSWTPSSSMPKTPHQTSRSSHLPNLYRRHPDG